jgi:hypothetical protein
VRVEAGLVLLVLTAKTAQELVAECHQLGHLGVVLAVVGDAQEVEDDLVNAHVPQQLLVLGLALGPVEAQILHPHQDLKNVSLGTFCFASNLLLSYHDKLSFRLSLCTDILD